MGFELFASLGLDGSGYTRGLRHAEDESKNFANKVKRENEGIGAELTKHLAGYFGIEQLKNFAEQSVQSVASIKQLARQYDITTDEQQALGEAARRNGLDFQNFGNVLTRINESRQQAVAGNMELRDTYARFGMTLKDVQTDELRDLDILMRLHEATKGLNLSSEERAALADIIGVKNERVIASLQDLEGARDAFKVSPEAIESVEHLHEKLRGLKREAEGLFATQLAKFLSGDLAALTPTSFIAEKARQREEAINRAPADMKFSGPGLFERIEREQQAHAFLGTTEDAKKLELKQTEAELEKALLKLEYEKLTPQQQEVRLQREINELRADAAELQRSGADIDKSFANVNLKMAAEKELQLLALTKKDKSEPAPLITDALARVGGFGASAGGETVGVLKESRDHLRQIRENTRASASGGYP